MKKITFSLVCLFLVGVGLVNAQSRSTSGEVLSTQNGVPIVGASVTMEKTVTGGIIDFCWKPLSTRLVQ
jgi:hypothetical protein